MLKSFDLSGKTFNGHRWAVVVHNGKKFYIDMGDSEKFCTVYTTFTRRSRGGKHQDCSRMVTSDRVREAVLTIVAKEIFGAN